MRHHCALANPSRRAVATFDCTRIRPVTERPAKDPGRVATWLVLALGLCLGVWLRAEPLSRAFLVGDELHSLSALGLSFGELAARYDAVGSGLALPLVQKSLIATFGASLPALRAVAFVPSLLLIALTGQWALREGGTRALFGALLLASLLPSLVFYGHYARSYSLAAMLCVAAAIVCARALARTPECTGKPLADGLTLSILGGLAVWAHLVSAFFLTGLGLGVALAISARRGPWGLLRAPAALGFVGAAAVAGLLHLPAASSTLAFVGRKGEQAYASSFGPMDVLDVLAGSTPGAWLVAVALVASAALEIRVRRAAAAPIVAATFAPGALLFLVSPYGDAYAYARYLLPSAAAGCVLVALGSLRCSEFVRERGWKWPAMALAAALAFGLHAMGPRGANAPDLGRFANTYLALYVLPAFTDVAALPPAGYENLRGAGRGLTVIEVPPLRNRAVHYLEALQRWHGHDVRMGTFGPVVPGAPPLDSDLYVDLSQIDIERGDADVLIVHRRIVDEVASHWKRVFAAVPEAERGALLERHRTFGHDLPSLGPGVIEKLEALLGPPTHEDVDIVLWRFDDPPVSTP